MREISIPLEALAAELELKISPDSVERNVKIAQEEKEARQLALKQQADAAGTGRKSDRSLRYRRSCEPWQMEPSWWMKRHAPILTPSRCTDRQRQSSTFTIAIPGHWRISSINSDFDWLAGPIQSRPKSPTRAPTPSDPKH